MINPLRDLSDKDTDDDEPAPTWQVVYTVVVVVVMFSVLIMDRVGTDCVMLTALTAFYVAGVITIKEALAGFSSQGLLTVLVLFVVAEGLNKTGALNWYVAKLLGRPKTLSGAQLRVMLPIAILSGFVNDTPLVTVTLPIVIQWAKKINLATRFVLMPLSFSALLGGVCTLIGTSTNLVIAGLLQDKYPDDPRFQNMSLFAIGQYGVPVAMAGVTYIIMATPKLLVRKGMKSCPATQDVEDLLLPARLTQWSPAAGRTIRRSGLRDTGGIYLVRVKRRATGNVHYAVGPEFVLQVGDILYFTGLVEEFGGFCAEHGLEVVTNEVAEHEQALSDCGTSDTHDDAASNETKSLAMEIQPIDHGTLSSDEFVLEHIGTTLESVLEADPQERMRVIYRMEDAIRNTNVYAHVDDRDRIIVTTDSDNMVVLAVDTLDRSALMLDISKCLARLQLELHHTEAAVVGTRSLSIWRCECPHLPCPSIEETWSVVDALLANDCGLEAVQKRGLKVLRAQVLDHGRLVGITASDIGFRQTYKAAIVAIQKGGKTKTESLSSVKFDAGDLLILQASDDSPLLQPPPKEFYENLNASGKKCENPSITTAGCVHRHRTNLDRSEETIFPEPDFSAGADDPDFGSAIFVSNGGTPSSHRDAAVWKDLRVIVSDGNSGQPPLREFLTAMTIAPSSKLKGHTVAQAGIDKLPDIYLVNIERPEPVDIEQPAARSDSGTDSISYSAVALSEPLQPGDVLWFSGTAKAVGDLRRIPGLVSYQNEEVEKMKEKVFDRRLVQAVVARKGPLVGKTVKEVRFRTQYGAAVIAVQREGQRVHEHPGQVKLQAGDVLLLEAGPSFMANKVQHDRSFALVAEVQDSAPPRLRMLIPAVLLTVGAYGAYMAKLSTLFGTAMVAAILMVALGVLSESEARAAIQWEIYLTIASAFGIGTALVNSGVAGSVANFLVKIGDGVGIGDAGILGAVYISTVLISQLVANNAAAALIFPIAMDAAEQTGTDMVLMSFTIMLAASAAFMTPFGYQTNLMVMGYGGYNTMDYLRFGTPMQIVLWIATTTYLVSPAWICWVVTFAVFVTACVYRVMTNLKSNGQKSI